MGGLLLLLLYEVGLIREKGKATAREAQQCPEAVAPNGRSWYYIFKIDRCFPTSDSCLPGAISESPVEVF
jgi:hypothetical protein